MPECFKTFRDQKSCPSIPLGVPCLRIKPNFQTVYGNEIYENRVTRAVAKCFTEFSHPFLGAIPQNKDSLERQECELLVRAVMQDSELTPQFQKPRIGEKPLRILAVWLLPILDKKWRLIWQRGQSWFTSQVTAAWARK